MSQMSELSARRARPETLARLLVCIEMRAAQPCLAQRALRGSRALRIWLRLAISTPAGRKLCSGSMMTRVGAAFPTYFAKLVSGMQSGLPVRAK